MRDSQDSWMFDADKSISDNIEESENKSKHVIDFSKQKPLPDLSDDKRKSSAIVGQLKSLQSRNKAEVE